MSRFHRTRCRQGGIALGRVLASLIATVACCGVAQAAEGTPSSILTLHAVTVWRELLDSAKALPRLDTALSSLHLAHGDPIAVAVRSTRPGQLRWLAVDARGAPRLLLPRDLPVTAGTWWRSPARATAPQALTLPNPGRHLLLAILLPTSDRARGAGGDERTPHNDPDAESDQALQDLRVAMKRTVQGQGSSLLAVALELLRVCEGATPCLSPARTRSAVEELESLLAPQGTLPPGIFRDPEWPVGTPVRTLPHSALELVKSAEGWRASLYEDPAGYCTIGHGHLVNLGPCHDGSRARFPEPLTPEAGEALLREDLRAAQLAAERLVAVRLEESQYAALVSFVFNVGASRFARSQIRAALHRGEPDLARSELLTWTAARGIQLEGLKRRRQREAELFDQYRWALSPAEVRRLEIRGLALKRVDDLTEAVVDIEVGD